MSNFVQKPGFGSFFRNNKQSENQPDYRGDICTPSGEQLQIAGWLKKDKNDKTFMSLKVQVPREKDEPTQRKSPLNTPAPARAPMDDDIPF